MIANIATSITDKLVKNGVIPHENREIYQYGFELGMTQAISIVTTLAIGFLLRMPLESIAFLLSFMTLRTYAGGYHASSHLNCFILSTALTISILLTGHFFIYNAWEYVAVILGVVGAFTILPLAPVDDPNKRMDDVEQIVYRRRTVKYLIVWTILAILLYFTPFKSLSVIICLSVFFIGVIVFCGYLENKAFRKRARK